MGWGWGLALGRVAVCESYRDLLREVRIGVRAGVRIGVGIRVRNESADEPT